MKQCTKKMFAWILAVVMVTGILPFASIARLDFSSMSLTAKAEGYNVGDIITFGGYPQSEVTDEATVSALNEIVLEADWISYGYCSGNGQLRSQIVGDWMKFCDIEYNGNLYRGVRFEKYRPRTSYSEATTTYSNSSQYLNNYYINQTYWFMWEALHWKVVDPSIGFVISEMLLDSQAFCDYYYKSNQYNEEQYKNYSGTYASDYAESSIRKWLKDVFYDTAFSDAEKNAIGYTDLDNSAEGSTSPKFDGGPTTDKVFLLGINDSTINTEDRIKKGTDYALSQGLEIDRNTTSPFKGCGSWCLRNPGCWDKSASVSVCLVGVNGFCDSVGKDVGCDRYGVCPCFCFKSDIIETLNPYGGKHGEHVWNDGVVSKQSTCKEQGETLFTCTVCGATKTEPIAVDENNHADYGTHIENAMDAACGVPGYTGDTVCNECGAVRTAGSEISALEHNWSVWTDNGDGKHIRECSLCHVTETVAHVWNDGVVSKQSTCKEQGETLFTCTVCGATKTEPIAVDENNHADYGTHIENAASATCGVPGYTGDTVCDECGAVLIDGKEIPALEHSWGAWSDNGDGKHIRECSLCHDTETVAHVWNDGVVSKAATCKEQGEMLFTCTVCGTTKTASIPVDAGNHANYGTRIEHKKDATCTEKGYTGDTVCKGCGAVLTTGREIPATGHVDTDKDDHCDLCGKKMRSDAPTEPTRPDTGDEDLRICRYCGKVHSDRFPDSFMYLVHVILYFFKLAFVKR